MIRRFIAFGLAASALAGAACAAAQAGGDRPLVGERAPTRVEIRIRYSKFEPANVTVRAGVPVTYVIRNEDPIDHEWLIGDTAFHARHRSGTEAIHGDRPDEVSVPAGATRTTTLTLAAGAYGFVCHFAGHEGYGMVGVVRAR